MTKPPAPYGKLFYEDQIEAFEEAQRIRAEHKGAMFVKVSASPYGGYQITVMPVEAAISLMGTAASPFGGRWEYF